MNFTIKDGLRLEKIGSINLHVSDILIADINYSHTKCNTIEKGFILNGFYEKF